MDDLNSVTPDQLAEMLAGHDQHGADGGKMEKTMSEFKHGTLHSGSKEGPKVTSREQAIAIGMNQARKEGEDVPPKK